MLNNARRHGLRLPQAVDLYSSASWFDGWREKLRVRGLRSVLRPVAEARTWVLTTGWRRHRLIGFEEVPGPLG